MKYTVLVLFRWLRLRACVLTKMSIFLFFLGRAEAEGDEPLAAMSKGIVVVQTLAEAVQQGFADDVAIAVVRGAVDLAAVPDAILSFRMRREPQNPFLNSAWRAARSFVRERGARQRDAALREMVPGLTEADEVLRQVVDGIFARPPRGFTYNRFNKLRGGPSRSTTGFHVDSPTTLGVFTFDISPIENGLLLSPTAHLWGVKTQNAFPSAPYASRLAYIRDWYSLPTDKAAAGLLAGDPIEMYPGDAAFIPRGAIHHAQALRQDRMLVTTTSRPGARAEALTLAEQRIRRAPRLR